MFQPYPNGMMIGDLLPKDAFQRLKQDKPLVDKVRVAVKAPPNKIEEPTLNMTKLAKEVEHNEFVLMNRGLQQLYQTLYGRKFKTVKDLIKGDLRCTRKTKKEFDKQLRSHGLIRCREMDKVIMLDHSKVR
jgi:hypothetical protein